MPIKPENRWLYPIDWLQLSDVIRFERAGGRCEGCGRPHGQMVCHLGDGRWWDEAAQTWRSGRGRALKLAPPNALPAAVEIRNTQVVLACAHLDHDPQNNHPKNLKALCQRCHIIHDKAEHLRERWITYRLRKALPVQSRGEVGRIVSEPVRIVCPGSAGRFVWREASEGLSDRVPEVADRSSGFGSKNGLKLGECLVPRCGGTIAAAWRDALWDKFSTAAPRRLRRSVGQSKLVKRA